MKTTTVTLVLTLIFQLISAQDLPDDAKELMAKLNEFERSENQRAAENIQNKRSAVAEILSKLMERETKSGNLESAIALKDLVAELSQPGKANIPAEIAQPSNGTGLPEGKRNFKKWIESIEFVLKSGEIYYYKDGKTTIELEGGLKGSEFQSELTDRGLRWFFQGDSSKPIELIADTKTTGRLVRGSTGAGTVNVTIRPRK